MPAQAGFAWGPFFRALAAARQRVLMLDYDGTLAPFQTRRDKARIYPELRPILARLARSPETRLIIISGRALRDLVPLLDLDPLPELWGSHGWERQTADGISSGPALDAPTREKLATALTRARALAAPECCEAKPAGVAVHWRGLASPEIETLRRRVRDAWSPLAEGDGLLVQEFDGGVELRAAGRDKGSAVRDILREIDAGAVVAYAGDDQTDEDAFAALAGRGLSILARPAYRPTAADVWLKTPEELGRFLSAWQVTDEQRGNV